MAHAGGRPTKYRKKYCTEMLEYFSVPFTKIEKRLVMTKLGVEFVNDEKPNRLPTMEGFANKIGVIAETLIEWAKKYPEFSEAYRKALSFEKEFLVQNGLAGHYPPNIFQFIAQNLTDMKDKKEVEHSGDMKVEIVNYKGASQGADPA